MRFHTTFVSQNSSKILLFVIASAFVLLAQPALATVTFLNAWGTFGIGDGQFDDPSGLAVSSSGDVYVADRRNARIQRFDATGNFELQWGSAGSGDGQFSYPSGVAVSPSGQVYVVDNGNDRIQRFDADGNYEFQWGNTGFGDGQFIIPADVALSPSGQVYVSDQYNNRIQRFDAYGNYQLQWGSYGSGDGQLDAPIGLAVDPSGQVYVAEADNERIQVFDANGNYQTQWGSYGYGDGQFNTTWAVAVSLSGHVYVADSIVCRVQRFDNVGNYQTHWGSVGSGNGQFLHPEGIAVVPSGHIYIVDSLNHRIQRFFDSDAWVSGTNTFVDGSIGPTSVDVGPGEILGNALTLDANKELVVGGTTTVQSGGTLTLDGGSIVTGSLVNNGGTFEFQSGVIILTNGDFQVSPSGPLGSNVFIDSGKVLQPTYLNVGSSSGGVMGISDGGSVAAASHITIGTLGAESGNVIVSGLGSALFSDMHLNVGIAGDASLSVTDGAQVSTVHAAIATLPGAIGVADVAGFGSRWTVTQDLHVAGDPINGPGGTGVLNVSEGGLVTAATDLVIHPDGEIRLAQGGRLGGGTLSNSGLLHGDGRVDNVLDNTTDGEVMVASGDQLTFTATGNLNAGQISLLGGVTVFQQGLTNTTDGLILGNGTLRADGGLTNNGDMALSATANIVGDVTNGSTGLITSSGGTTTFFDDVQNDGEIRTNLNSFTVYYGSYSGNGDTGTGTVIMEGDLKPGFSPGTMEFYGDLAFGQDSALEIELGGTLGGNFDRVEVVGYIALNGSLDVQLFGGFVPNAGDTFEILTAGSLLGSFDSISLPSLPGDLLWFVNQTATSLELVSTYAADFDEDGDVDDDDLAAWDGGFGSGVATHMTGDANFSTTANGFDFLAWQRQRGYGGSLSGIAAASIPEPSTWGLLLLGLVSIFSGRLMKAGRHV